MAIARRTEIEVISLSFLDLLCCAFGAVILLVLLLLPGKGVSDQDEMEWNLVRFGEVTCAGFTEHYEDVKIAIVGSSVPGIRGERLPLSVSHVDHSAVRFQFIPMFAKEDGNGTDTVLTGVHCEVFTYGDAEYDPEETRILVYAGENQPRCEMHVKDLPED